MNYDVTVSVWNEFQAPEMCRGLARSALRVLALRTGKSPLEGITSERCDISRILTGLFQRTKWRPLIYAARSSFDRFAAKRVGKSRIFWGWNGHNLRSFKEAKKAGQIVVCDCVSTNSAWSVSKLSQVHKELGWGPTNLTTDKREHRLNLEYEIADHIVVPSQFVRKTFLEQGTAEEKIHVNAYGVDPEKWLHIRGNKRRNGSLVFVFVAHIIPRKGPHILLQAWNKAKVPNAELWMIGGVYFPIQKMFPTNSNVKFLGYRDYTELQTIYDRASVFVLPSFEEGMARSGIEAMAAGLPLIVTEETGLTDLMVPGKHGWSVPSNDPDRLADRLRQVAENRDALREMSSLCQLTASAFTKQAYGERAATLAKMFLG